MGITAYKSDGMLNVSWTNLLGRQLLIVNSTTGKYVVIRSQITQANNAFSINLSNFKHTYHLVNGTYYFSATKLGKSPIQSSLVVIDEPIEVTFSLVQDNILTVNISNTEDFEVGTHLYLLRDNNYSPETAILLASSTSDQVLPISSTYILSDQTYINATAIVTGSYGVHLYFGTTLLYSSANNFYYAETGTWPLSVVLQAGNAVSANIDLNNNSILHANIYSNNMYTQNIWFPAGNIMPTISESIAAPAEGVYNGWLLCNGAQFNVNEYPELATILTNGKLPNLQGLFLRGSTDIIKKTSRFITEEHSHGLNISSHLHVSADNLNSPDPNGKYLGRNEEFNRDGGGYFGSTSDISQSLTTSLAYTGITTAPAHSGNTETAPSNYGVYWVISTGKRVPPSNFEII